MESASMYGSEPIRELYIEAKSASMIGSDCQYIEAEIIYFLMWCVWANHRAVHWGRFRTLRPIPYDSMYSSLILPQCTELASMYGIGLNVQYIEAYSLYIEGNFVYWGLIWCQTVSASFGLIWCQTVSASLVPHLTSKSICFIWPNFMSISICLIGASFDVTQYLRPCANLRPRIDLRAARKFEAAHKLRQRRFEATCRLRPCANLRPHAGLRLSTDLRQRADWGRAQIETTCELRLCTNLSLHADLRQRADWASLCTLRPHANLRPRADWGRMQIWGRTQIEAVHRLRQSVYIVGSAQIWGRVQIEAVCKFEAVHRFEAAAQIQAVCVHWGCTLRPILYIEADSVHWGTIRAVHWGKIGLNVWNRPQCTVHWSKFSAQYIWGRFRTLRPILAKLIDRQIRSIRCAINPWFLVCLANKR